MLIPLLKTQKKTLVNESINLLHRYLTRKKAKNSTLALVLDRLKNRQRSSSDLVPIIITYVNVIVIVLLKYCSDVICLAGTRGTGTLSLSLLNRHLFFFL